VLVLDADEDADEDPAPDKHDRDLDRELNEFLQELRIMLPGVQVLLAFLLTVAFTNKFSTLSDEERGLYFGAVMATSFAIVLLLTPGIQHRMRFRQHDKEALLRSANRLALAATVAVGVAIGSVVFLLANYLYGVVFASVVTAVLVVAMLVLWYALPWRRRHDRDGGDIET
jgi:predicted MFS family arabinose efflux permease